MYWLGFLPLCFRRYHALPAVVIPVTPLRENSSLLVSEQKKLLFPPRLRARRRPGSTGMLVRPGARLAPLERPLSTRSLRIPQAILDHLFERRFYRASEPVMTGRRPSGQRRRETRQATTHAAKNVLSLGLNNASTARPRAPIRYR